MNKVGQSPQCGEVGGVWHSSHDKVLQMRSTPPYGVTPGSLWRKWDFQVYYPPAERKAGFCCIVVHTYTGMLAGDILLNLNGDIKRSFQWFRPVVVDLFSNTLNTTSFQGERLS